MSEIGRCEYCGRGMYLSEGDSCKGCGSPFPPVSRHVPVIMYDSSKIDPAEIATFRPGMNIPIGGVRFEALQDYVRMQVIDAARYFDNGL